MINLTVSMPSPPEQAPCLRAAQDLFIRHWAEIGQLWGINRTMAEIHALLYICGQPQCTDDVMARLNISRGNVSTCLRTLCEWGIIQRVHLRRERKDYYQSLASMWEIFGILAANRKRRNIDPMLARIISCKALLGEMPLERVEDNASVATARRRIEEIESLMTAMSAMSDEFISRVKSKQRTALARGVRPAGRLVS